MVEIPLLLLAAGGSSRMGTPKPLLKWGDQTLIEHRIRTCLGTGQPVIVILGSGAEEIQPLLDHFSVELFINKDWEEGMGSSIQCGIKEMKKTFPGAEGVIIALVDQPLVSHQHFRKMINLFDPGAEKILVSRDKSGLQGVPVLFDRSYFDTLQEIKRDKGAKSIIRQHPDEVQIVPCDEVLDDMDTPRDYLRLLRLFST